MSGLFCGKLAFNKALGTKSASVLFTGEVDVSSEIQCIVWNQYHISG